MNNEPKLMLEVQRSPVLATAQRADGGDLALDGKVLVGQRFPVFGQAPDVGGVAVEQFEDEVVGVLTLGEEDKAKIGAENVAELRGGLVQASG